MTFRLLTCLLAVTTLLAACGSDDTGPEAAEGAGDGPTTSAASAPGDPAPPDEVGDEEPPDEETADGPPSVPDFFDFTLEDVRGGQVEGESFAGTDVVVWFWAPWCTKCNQEAAAIASLAAQRDDVTFLGMAGLDGMAAARDFVDRHGLEGFAHAYDEAGDSWPAFGITSQSSFAFVDDDGSVETESYVTLGGDEIAERIDRLVAS